MRLITSSIKYEVVVIVLFLLYTLVVVPVILCYLWQREHNERLNLWDYVHFVKWKRVYYKKRTNEDRNNGCTFSADINEWQKRFISNYFAIQIRLVITIRSFLIQIVYEATDQCSVTQRFYYIYSKHLIWWIIFL